MTNYYFPAPPYILSYKEYQDVNSDKNLQKKVTSYFLDELLLWLDNDKNFTELKYLKKHFNSDDGFITMHKLLRLFVKKGKTNWYDLKIQYNLVKRYLKFKLSSY